MGAMEFYEEMSKAIKERDHARSMAKRWDTKVLDAEFKIEALVQSQDRAVQPEVEA